MPAQITPTVLGRGAKNAAIAGIGLVTVFGLGSYGLAAATDRSLGWAYGVVGAVGLRGLTSYKWLLHGAGHIVAPYTGPTARRFRHVAVETHTPRC